MSSKNGIVIKGTMDYQSVIAFLEDVVNSFKARTVCVQRGDEFITLTPAESIEMELEAVEKKGKQKLSLELEWREEVQVEAGVPFKVSCEVPEPAEPEAESEEGATAEAGAAPTETPDAAKAPASTEAADAKGKSTIKQPEAGLGNAAARDEKADTKEKGKTVKMPEKGLGTPGKK